MFLSVEILVSAAEQHPRHDESEATTSREKVIVWSSSNFDMKDKSVDLSRIYNPVSEGHENSA